MSGKYLFAGAALCGAALSASLPKLVLKPVADGRVHKSDVQNLEPSLSINLKAADPRAQQLVSMTFKMKQPAVALENSDLVSVQCSDDSSAIELTFSDHETFDVATTWPKGLVLVTNSETCNNNDERGVYVTEDAEFNSHRRSVVMKTTRSSFQDVSETTTLGFELNDLAGEMIPNEETTPNEELRKRDTVPAQPSQPLKCQAVLPTNPKFRCGVYGTLSKPATPLTSSVNSTSKGMQACRDSCLKTTGCQTFGYQATGNKCTLYPASLVAQGYQKKATGPVVFYNKRCFYNCTYSNGLSTAAQAILTELQTGVTKDSDGNIVGNLAQFLPTAPLAVPAPDFDPNNSALQAQLQQELANDGLATSDDIVSDSASTLSTPDGIDDPDANGITFEEGVPEADSTKLVRPRTPGSGVSRLAKRFDWWDDLVCNEVLTTLSDKLEGVCSAVDAAKAIACFAKGECTFDGHPLPPRTKYPFTFEYSMNSPDWKNALLIPAQGSNTLSCVDCSYSISSLQFSGEMVIQNDNQNILSSTLNVAQNSVSNVILRLKSSGAWASKADVTLGTATFQPVELKDVFSIKPKLVYGFGADWQTDQAVDVVGGARMTLSGAGVGLDVASGNISNVGGWTPQTKLTYPSLPSKQVGRLAFVPFIRSTIQMQATILGRSYNKLASLTSQHSMGFDVQRLAPATKAKRADTSDPDSFSPNPAKRQSPSLFDAMGNRTPICAAGSMQVRTAHKSVYQAVYSQDTGMAPSTLFYRKLDLKGQCYDVPKNVPAPVLPCADDSPDGTCDDSSDSTKKPFGLASDYYCLYLGNLSGALPGSADDMKACIDQCRDWNLCGQAAWRPFDNGNGGSCYTGISTSVSAICKPQSALSGPFTNLCTSNPTFCGYTFISKNY